MRLPRERLTSEQEAYAMYADDPSTAVRILGTAATMAKTVRNSGAFPGGNGIRTLEVAEHFRKSARNSGGDEAIIATTIAVLDFNNLQPSFA